MDTLEQTKFLAGCVANHDLTCANHWMLRPQIYHWAYIVAGLIGVLGVAQFIGGATYRSMKEVMCATCNRRVVGKKVLFGIQCPVGPHMASRYFGKLLLFVILVFVVIALVAKA